MMALGLQEAPDSLRRLKSVFSMNCGQQITACESQRAILNATAAAGDKHTNKASNLWEQSRKQLQQLSCPVV